MPIAVSPVVERALAELRSRLRAHFGENLVEVRLFGSFARGEATESSDVDVFVLLRSVTFVDKARAIDLATEVSLESELHLSPTVFDVERYAQWMREERRLALDIANEGIPI